ncbi:MAG: thioredoxin family protein [Halothiobacillaceae bacterium]|nr:thioredoxin family protein [Halothiobacillaceae bacterium]
MLYRLRAPLIGLLCLYAPIAPTQAANLPALTDLRADLAEVRTRKAPLLVLFYASYCHYCRQVESEFLEPMSRNPDIARSLLIRRVSLDGLDIVIDTDGREIEASAFARRYHVRFAPTVLLLGPEGQVLAPPVIGLTNPDFYGGDLDRAIAQARARLLGKER